MSFRFTITGDKRDGNYTGSQPGNYTQIRDRTYKAIKDIFGDEGLWHISVGDQDDDSLNRAIGIDGAFGYDSVWVPVIGNHEFQSADCYCGQTPGCVPWLRNEFLGGEDPSSDRPGLQHSLNAVAGPAGSSETTYYWDLENVRFIVLNTFWDGGEVRTGYVTPPDSDVSNGSGKILQVHLDWLEPVLKEAKELGKGVFIFSHIPAFNDNRKKPLSYLVVDKATRDKFWSMLEDYDVMAYFCGHSHNYSAYLVGPNTITGVDTWDHESKWDRKNNVWHIETGQGTLHNWGLGDPDQPAYETFINVDVQEDVVILDVYQNAPGDWGTWRSIRTVTIPIPSTDEYEAENRGGVCYYTQNKIGSEWVNNVDNSKGWTIDFNLKVSDIYNGDWILDENEKGKGIGLYVNDGAKQENINFMSQEIIFSNADYTRIYDATQEVDYRLIGKKENLKLYGRPEGNSLYEKIAEVNFSKSATPNGNALNPFIFEDTSGNLHAAWWDDGGNLGSLFYSKFNGTTWSSPEEIVSLDNGVQFPSILVDSDENIYVVFESKQTEGSVVGLVYKNSIGWSLPYYTGEDIGLCKHPRITFDSQSNVCVVWEDHRQTHQEIYINIFLKDELSWKGEEKLSDNTFGSYRPSISSYLDDLYISWTVKDTDNTSHIDVMKYNALHSTRTGPVTISNLNVRADHSNILCNVAGNIFVVWHDNIEGKYIIYSAILSPLLDILTSAQDIVVGNGGAMYPVLSEQSSTGDVYIAWQDFKEGDFDSIVPVPPDPYDEYYPGGPYEERAAQQIEPISSSIFVAVYKDGIFESSGAGSFDVKLIFKDERNSYFPNIPVFFNSELPIVYNFYLFEEYGFVGSMDMLSRIGCAFYDLSRDSDEFVVNYGSVVRDPSIGQESNRDYVLNEEIATKEIRFGDFSDVVNVNYVFKDFKYYLDDAVEPYSIVEIGNNVSGIEFVSSQEALVNNYGDVWIVGVCGTYYYLSDQRRMLQVGVDLPWTSDTVTDQDLELLKTFKAIAFDSHNNMFIMGNNGICKYSVEHFNGFSDLVLPSLDASLDITSVVFDKNNIMYVGTTGGLFAYDVSYTESVTSGVPSTTISATVKDEDIFSSSFANYPSGHISSLKVDDNNCLWIGSYDGVYRFFKDRFLHFTSVNGLPSDRVNDIAIRNTAIRYIATARGVSKMVGFSFDTIIDSEDDSIWNNNVKSVMWRDPNILFSGTMSRLNQIVVDDVDEIYSTVFYEPGSSINVSSDDFQTYYLDDSNITISENDIIDVYINGNKIPHGFDVGTDNKTIRFRTPLFHEDIVEVIVRSDLEEISTFQQSSYEKTQVGSNIIRIKDLASTSSTIYASTTGADTEVKINDSDSILPFDRVHLDTHPPVITKDGLGIQIGDQVDRSIIKVSIDGAIDNVYETEGDPSTALVAEGSGIDRMIISNNDRFLDDDGVTSLLSVPYATSATHDLGLTLEQVVKDLEISAGYGSVVSYIVSNNELYAGTSLPAKVYKYDWAKEEWEVLFEYDEDKYIDFIEKYNNNLLVSVGHGNDPALVYVYNYTSNGLVESIVLPLTESRGFSHHELDGKFYIGAGMGDGDEYSEGAGSSGAVYVFNDGTATGEDPDITKVVEELDENVYGLTSVSGSVNLLASTGPDGYVYEIDVENKASLIVYNSSESLSAILHQEDIGETFVGGNTSGIIRRSVISNNTYDISFRTVAGKVSTLKMFPVITGFSGTSAYNSTFAAVGNTIYYLSDAGTWVWKYTHSETINDMTFDTRSNKNMLYVISQSGVTRIHPLAEEKVVYLKLIDRAGNQTVLDYTIDADGSVDADSSKFVDSVPISSLVDFVNENMILELDELGNTVYTLNSDNRFYSADKIEEERGEYVSEIFDGTNNLVKWDSISWQVTELFDTYVQVYVRTSTSSNDILTASWQGPYLSDVSSGVDISHLSGQFIQFKAVLVSEAKGYTPVFHRASIRAITSESIHFFTTNFVMPTRLNKGIITSQQVLPVAADIVFGVNTTNSVDWTEYQEVDENRVFNINQTGHNLRVGIKLISPNRTSIIPTTFDEYGPYDSLLYVNTVDFDLTNKTGTTNNYHFKVSLYKDILLQEEVFSAYSADSPDGFSVDGVAIPEGGVSISNNSTANVLFTVPGSANIECEKFYFVQIEYIYDADFILYSNDRSFVASCTSSFIDTINFDFTNDGINADYFHFRIKFYQDPERTNEYATVFSGNDRTGWMVDDYLIPEDGALVAPAQTVNVVYRPDPDDFDSASIYYLTIEAHDGEDYVFATNFYTFQTRDVQSKESCGEYEDVPIVKNFGIMFELDNNEFITLNI